MLQPAHVRLEEGAQVWHAVFEHGEPVDAHAEGEALDLIRVEAAAAQHVGVDHAAAEDFQPVGALAEAQLAALARTLDVHFRRRLGEGEERGAEAHRHGLDLEEGAAERFEHPFEIGDVGRAVDHEPFDLMEHRGVGLVGIVPVGAAGHDHADRRLLGAHGAHLNRRSVGAQQLAPPEMVGGEKERVVHLPRRVAFGEVERGEVQLVRLDVGPFGHREAEIGEDRGDLLDHLADRVDAAADLRRLAQGKRHVDALGGEPGVEGGFRQRLALGEDRALHPVAQAVDEGAALATLVGRHRTQRLEELRDAALLAEGRHAQGFEARLVPGPLDLPEEVAFESVEIHHRCPYRSSECCVRGCCCASPGHAQAPRRIGAGTPGEVRARKTRRRGACRAAPCQRVVPPLSGAVRRPSAGPTSPSRRRRRRQPARGWRARTGPCGPPGCRTWPARR